MTNRWINTVLAVVVVVGMVAANLLQRPRLAQEQAEFLGQQVRVLEETATPEAAVDRRPIEFDPGDTSGAEPEEVAAQLGDHGVSSGNPIGVEVGMQVLEAGGNAVDAAIAVAYVLGTVEPFGSGIGGGGSMVIVEPGQDPVAYDYREIAPLSGEVPASNIGVPGFVAGMEHIHARHGTLPLDRLIDPAARYAEEGFVVGEYLRERLLAATYRMPTHLIPTFFPGGSTVEAGEVVRQPGLGEALRKIQDQGKAAFYTGSIAQAITDEVSGLSMEDFAAYEVLELEPSRGTYAGYDIIGPSAPLGGPVVIQMLQIAEELGVDDAAPDTVEYLHEAAQSWRVAMNQRVEFLGDPTFVDVDDAGFTSLERARELAAIIPSDGFADVSEWEDPLTTESDTTHVVVVDDTGRMVSFTNTLSNFFGSGLQVHGFFLNDQLKNFSRNPESVNFVAPGKRPRSFSAPMVVARDGRPILGIGTPGGRRIPSMIAQVIIRWAGWGEPIEQAVRAPRFHLENRVLHVEESPPGDVVAALTARGYEVTVAVPSTEFYGAMQTLVVDWDEGRIHSADDGRREGAWDAASRQG